MSGIGKIALSNLRSIEKSQTLLINEQSRLLQQKGKKVYKLGFGQSPFSPPRRVTQALQDSSTSNNGYSPVQGLPALRHSATEFHRQVQGLDYLHSDNCLVAPGSKMLLYTIMAAFTKADVLIPSPAWVSYKPQAHLLGHDVVRINTDFESRWRVSAESLANAASKCRADAQKILILNYPGNPDGLIYTEAELQELAQVMKANDIFVIADEIYALLTYDYSSFVSIAKYYPEGTCITTGLSKWCGSGGWRLGLCFLPPEYNDLMEILLGIASETYSCAPSIVQEAACTAYKLDEVTYGYLHNQRQILHLLSFKLHGMLTAAGINVHRAQGGFYFFIDFSPFALALKDKYSISTSEELCRKLLSDTGVALLHGEVFGFAPTKLTARLAFVDFDGDAALQAANTSEINAQFIEKQCDTTIEGVRQLCLWIASIV